MKKSTKTLSALVALALLLSFTVSTVSFAISPTLIFDWAAPQKSAAEVRADEVLARMTLREKIFQMFIIKPENLEGSTKTEFQNGEERLKRANAQTKAALAKYPVGGIIYFADNLQSRDQTKTMIANSQKYANELYGIPLFICVDEEGGIVARCGKKLGTTKFKPMQTYENQGTKVAHDNAQTLARDIRQFGFNVDFAPVADVNSAQNSVIGTRAYSSDYNKAATLVASAVTGFQDGGVACTLKHFPGHGDTQEDSHEGTAHLKKSLSQLKTQEFLPFQAGIAAGADMVMVGHIVTDKIDAKYPATLSQKVVTGILRNDLGYDGLVVTDSMGMGAIAQYYSPGDAAVLAVQAGDDLLLGIYDVERAYQGIYQAVCNGTLSEKRINESVKRILLQKAEMGLI